MGDGDGVEPAGEPPAARGSHGPSYVSQIHLEWVAILIVITVVLAVVGWSLRPQARGFPSVSSQPSVFVEGGGAPTVTQTLTRDASGAEELQVLAYPRRPGPWEVVVGNYGSSTICNQRRTQVPAANPMYFYLLNAPRVTRANLGVPGYGNNWVRYVRATGPVVYVRICWRSGARDAPLQIDGAYLNAKLPTVRPDRLDSRLTVRSIVVPNDGDTSDFAVQDESAPSSSNGAGWGWTQSWREPPIQLTAVNTSAQQNAQYRAFLSGILIAVAGGAFITILQELVAPLNRRRDERPIPGGASMPPADFQDRREPSSRFE